MALTKVSGGILDPGINVAGIVTATGFDGPFTGGSGSNIIAGIITATELDVNGNGDISGNLVVGGNLTANGDFTTLNTTLREVEILHVSAGSSATAGIITQTGTGDIFSAYDTSTQVFKIADGGDITFFGGSNSKNASWDYSTNTLSFDGNGSVNNQYAKTQFGSASQGMKLYNNLNNFISVPPIVALFVESADFQIYGSGSRGGTTYDGTIFIAREGVVELGHEVGGGGATGMKLKTVGYGVTILGTTETQKLNVTGISTFADVVGFSSDVNITGITTFNDHVNVAQGKVINFGNTNGTTGHIYYDGSTTRLQTNQGLNIGAPVVSLKGAGLVGVMGEFIQNGVVKLFENSNLKFQTTGIGVSVVGIASATSFTSIDSGVSGQYKSNEIEFDRNSYNYISCTDDSGQLVIRMGSSETTAFAVDTSADTIFSNNRKIKMGSDKLQLYHDSSDNHSYIKESGSGDLLIQGTQIKLQDASGTDYIRAFTGGAVYLHNAGNSKFETTSTGVHVTGEVSASQDYPDLKPRLDFNFAATKKLDPRITYYRTGPASFTDEFGKVVLVGDNTPRFDHDPLTGESKGLLIETTRTNLLSYSVPNSAWNLSQATITENAGIAPDGTNTAVLHSDNNTNNQHLLYTTATVSDATNYVITSYLKQPSSNSRRYYSMTIHGLGYIIFDVQTGTVHNVSGTGIQDATITAVGNGWYRAKAHYVTTSTTGNIYWLPIADNGSDVVYTGASTAQGMLVWGCQLEQATYETSYIPTFGSTAIRGYEQTVVDREDFTDFYNPSESSVLAVGTVQRPVAAQGQLNIFHVGNSNDDGHGVFREHGTKDVFYHIRNNNSTPTGGNIVPSGYGDWSKGREARIAIAFKDGDQAISVNGGNQVTATVTSNYPTNNITKMWIGSASGNGSGQFEGTIKRIAYYSKLLTDNQLNTLTA